MSLYKKIKVAVVNSSLEKKYHSYGDHWVDGFKDAGCIVDQYKYKDIPLLPLNYDLYFFVEIRYNPAQIPWYVTPRVMYSWDSHVAGTDVYKKIACHFDRVYLASKIDVETLGINNVLWLPEACNPRLHREKAMDRDKDIVFVGRTNGEIKRNGLVKDELLNWIRSSGYSFIIEKDKWGEDYAEIMNRGKISFDRTIAHNIGTRIFEASAMGCIPVWSDSGISDKIGINSLMKAGKHYIPYSDTIKSLKETIEGIIGNPGRMERIIEDAKSNVLANHTYAHRAKYVVEDILSETIDIQFR